MADGISFRSTAVQEIIVEAIGRTMRLRLAGERMKVITIDYADYSDDACPNCWHK
jgi:hypothetical protein